MTGFEDNDDFLIQPDPDKLGLHYRRQLSAMLDGELRPDQAKFMLRRLQHDSELAGCWDRWQLAGDIMRGRHDGLLPSDFADRVSRAIAEDADAGDVTGTAAGSTPRLLRWGGGAALAASVAMAALLVVRPEPVAVTGPASVEAAAEPGIADMSAAMTAGTVAVADTVVEQGQPGEQGDIGISAIDMVAAVAASAPVAVAVSAIQPTPSRQMRANVSTVSRISDAPAGAVEQDVAGPIPEMHRTHSRSNLSEDSGALVADLARPVVADETAARPWPRAVLPGLMDSTMTASTGGFAGDSRAFEGFSPNVATPSGFWPTQALPPAPPAVDTAQAIEVQPPSSR